MSALTPVVGYPTHRVTMFARWVNAHGVWFSDWTAACGASGRIAGRQRFSTAGKSLKTELCRTCFPDRTWGGIFPEPEDVSPKEGNDDK